MARFDLTLAQRWRTFLQLVLFAALAGSAAVQAATYTNSTTTYNWIDPSTHTKVGYNTSPYKLNKCGTTPPIMDDTISDVIPIGWNFVFGVTSYNSLRIETNGRLQFNNSACTSGTASVGPPQTYTYPYPVSNVNNTMRAFGVDLDPTNLVDKPNYPTAGSKTSCLNSSTCYISYASIGTAPFRQFVVSFVNVPEWVSTSNTSGSFTFQFILNEDGSFIYQYKTIVHGGTGKAQVGWQISTSDYGVLTFGASTEPGAPTAILFYIASANPLAEYRFTEGAWTAGLAGQVQDTNANTRPGTALGAAQSTASGYVCRGASIPLNTAGATVDAIKTGVKFSDASVNMTGQGTIMFWYQSKTAWNGTAAAQLIDASSVAGKWFYLTKTAAGTLYFEVTDSAGVLRSVETPALGIAANTWTHIAITWNFNALPAANSDDLQIFVNGGTPTLGAFSSSGNLNAQLDYVYAGDNPSGLTGTKGTVNSANGTMDELRFYNSELIQAQVGAISAATHPCPTFTIDHLELQPTTWSGSACAAGTMRVVACANASCSSLYTSGVQATLSATGTPTVWDAATGGATITVGYGMSSANKTFFMAPGSATIGVAGTGFPVAVAGATKCNGVGGSCVWTSSNGGLSLSVPNAAVITGGKPVAVSVQGVGTAPGSACAPIQGMTGVGLKLWAVANTPASFNSTSTSAAVTVGGSPQVANAQAGAYAYTPNALPAANNVAGLSFDSSAAASVWLKHMDSGSFTLYAQMDAPATATAPAFTMTGNTSVTSIPLGFGVAAPTVAATGVTQTGCATYPSATCDNAAGANARVASAGDSFPTTVTAALWTMNGDTDLTDNPVAPSFAGTATLSPVLAGPVGGSNGSLASTSATLAAGTSTLASQSWSQSGALVIAATGTYLGQNVSGQSMVLGRFSPKNFTTTLTTQGCGTFTYSGQPITAVTVKAMDGGSTPAVTPNYKGTYARPVTLSNANGSVPGAISVATIAANAFAAGAGTASPVFTFTSPLTPPQSIALRAADSDGITSAGSTEANAQILSGRVRLANAYGSELLAVTMPVFIEYYDSTGSAGWRTGTDTCTTLAPANFAFSFPVASSNYLSACKTALTTSGSNPKPKITLSAPGAGNKGWANVTLNLGATPTGTQCTSVGTGTGPAATTVGSPWLQFPWTGAAAINPTAQATFNVYRSPLIYFRENY